jgi:hypothetical protein
MKLLPQSISDQISLAWGRAWPLRSRLIPKSLKDEANAYLRERQSDMLFVMGSGRSGTQLISKLLDDTGRASVFHEPNYNEDVGTMDILRRDHEQAVLYWQEFRSAEVFRRWNSVPAGTMYGEVNGTIRYQVRAIKQLFPDAPIMLIARDGRGFVRSVMGWPQFYAPHSNGAFALAPLPGDKYEHEWSGMNRFSRICWSWQDTYELLMRYIPPTHWLTLEQATSDYGFFDRQFARNVGLPITQASWQRHVSRKSPNATRKYGFPAWEQWTEAQKQAFIRICGPTMRKLGYSIN